jgi:hypothetical protein
MSKLLLALQYWRGDRDLSMQVAKLIADLEPRHNPDVDFLFVSRFDCEHDLKAIEQVSSKFKVWHHINRHRRGMGWPAGCNDLWFGTMDHICSLTEAKIMPEYKAILTFEGDCAPMGPYWHKTLMASWEKVNKLRPVKVHGALVKWPGVHINGNCMFSGDLPFVHHISRKIGGCPPIYGWDFFLTKEFSRAGWADCPHIKSYWQRNTMDPEEVDNLVDTEVALLHGVKDDSVIKRIRERFVH